MKELGEVKAKADEIISKIAETHPEVAEEICVVVEDSGDGETVHSSFSLGEYERNSIAGFRKVNFLLPFFDYGDNCSDCEICRSQVEDLIDACKTVLASRYAENGHMIAESVLPTQSGFFFGSTQYDKYYYYDVEDVLNTFSTILNEFDFDNDVLYMNCWW